MRNLIHNRYEKNFISFNFKWKSSFGTIRISSSPVLMSKSSYNGTKAQIYALALGPFPSESPLPVPQSAPITSSIND